MTESEEIMNTFLTSNETRYRLLRTILQGIFGVIIANLDLFISYIQIDPALKPVIVAVVMAILSPIMSELGGKTND
jgi:multisubunit Na+/H+ antiporter MnhG subunit